VLAELLKRQLEVVAVTRCTANLANIDPAIRVVQMDIANPTADCYEQLGCPDVLIHLAWDGLPNYKSAHHFESELPKQYSFLANLIEAGLPALLVTGTCFEYGMQSGQLSETSAAMPDNPYARAKDTLRQQLETLKLHKSFNLIWARLFYMYGDGQPDTSLYPKLKEAIMRGDKAFNMSGGEQLRDYLPVEEVAREIVDLALSSCDASIVNICSGQPISVRKQVERWLKENHWEIELNLGVYPYPDYEPMAFWGDRSRLDSISEIKCLEKQ
jgi:dTDP-6-deoxy-L-talose 4-dehydrogenase (NAD+)